MILNTKFSKIINTLLFDYALMNEYEFFTRSKDLPPKLLRWLAAHHPDNRKRKLFFEITNVVIGEETVINSGFIVSDNYEPLLTIGNRVAISPNVVVICASSPNNSTLLNVSGFKDKYVKTLPVSIDDDSWIGTSAIILPGVRIGKKCIIGAGAVVCHDVFDGTIVAGIPAKKIGALDIEFKDNS
jgi:maltose O-acetyltransferase